MNPAADLPRLAVGPALAAAGYAAVRQPRLWRLAGVLLALPVAAALALAGRAHQPTLFPTEGIVSPDHLVTDGRIDPAAQRAMVTPHASGEVLWMCFQPGVLYALGGRQVFESYGNTPVDYHASRPVTLVVLRDHGQSMHPLTYANNYAQLDIMARAPNFVHGDYDVFVRPIGPDGVLARTALR